MAGLFGYAESAEITLAASGGWKTLLMLTAPANQRVNALSWGVYCRGTTNSAKPLRARLIRCSDSGTGGQSVTPQKRNTAFSETIQTAALGGAWATTEPSVSGGAVDEKTIHPQAGAEFPAYERRQWQLAGGERIAVQVNNDGGDSSLPVTADIGFEE